MSCVESAGYVPLVQAPHEHRKVPTCAVLSISSDLSVLASIKEVYDSDLFCQCLVETGAPGVQLINGLWYIGNRLVIPCMGNICKNLFHLAHDTLGHFGANKSYMVLQDAYYWPNMWSNLKKSYIPSCELR